MTALLSCDSFLIGDNFPCHVIVLLSCDNFPVGNSLSCHVTNLPSALSSRDQYGRLSVGISGTLYDTSNAMIFLTTSLLAFNTYTRVLVYFLLCRDIGGCFFISFNANRLGFILGLRWLSWEPWLGRTKR